MQSMFKKVLLVRWVCWNNKISLGGKDSLIFTLCHPDLWNEMTIVLKMKKIYILKWSVKL